MPGPSPNPNARRKNAPTIAWVTLPVERIGPAPKLPTWRKWQPPTLRWWKTLWSKPQATMWEQDGSTLIVLALMYDDVIAGRVDSGKWSAEIRQHEDRHGLSPRAMVQLRWRFGDGEDLVEASGEPGAVVSLADRRRGA